MAQTGKVLLGLILTVTIGGCSPQPDASDPTDAATRSEPTTGTATDTTGGTVGRTSGGATAASDSRITAPPQAGYSPDSEALNQWTSPSGNIDCVGSLVIPDEDEGGTGPEEPSVSCAVQGAEWSFPRPTEPGDTCPVEWTENEMWLGGSAGGGVCSGGQIDAMPAKVWTLDYGQEVRIGEVVCHSLRTGMLCVDRLTGSGFRAAQGSYDLFN